MPFRWGMNTRIHMALFGLAVALLSAACLPLEPGDNVALKVSDPELREIVAAADQRWEAAGVSAERVKLQPALAIPVRWATSAESAAYCELPPPQAGCTQYVEDVPVRVWISSDQPSERWLDIVTHELGHLLGVLDHLSYENMMGEDGAERISAADLEVACSVGACDGFAPER